MKNPDDPVGGILCEPVCGGKTPCFSACSLYGNTYSENSAFGDKHTDMTFSEATGIQLTETPGAGNIEYSLSGLALVDREKWKQSFQITIAMTR